MTLSLAAISITALNKNTQHDIILSVVMLSAVILCVTITPTMLSVALECQIKLISLSVVVLIIVTLNVVDHFMLLAMLHVCGMTNMLAYYSRATRLAKKV
jgi:hypothetical protein